MDELSNFSRKIPTNDIRCGQIGTADAALRGDLLPALPQRPIEAKVLHENLRTIFCEPEPVRRMEAIKRIWVRYPVVYDGDHSSAGYKAVFEAAERFQQRLGGADTVVNGGVIGHDGLFMILWRAERAGREFGLDGGHLAFFRGDRINSMHVIEGKG